jgi:phosphate transport system protein
MPEQRIVRERFTLALDALNQGVLELGSMVDKAIQKAMQALVEQDLDLARQVMVNDQALNRLRFDLENAALDILALQQPMARDLRFIMATQIIAIELERMGDYARGIAEIALRMGHAPPIQPVEDLPKMADIARAMLREVLDAFARRDVALARAIPQRDDAVDALNDRIYSEVIELMIQDPSTVNRATWLLWVTHNIERLADRVTNVAERVVFMVTGELVEMDVSSY